LDATLLKKRKLSVETHALKCNAGIGSSCGFWERPASQCDRLDKTNLAFLQGAFQFVQISVRCMGSFCEIMRKANPGALAATMDT
jgi:hypothetical protein